MPADTPYAGMPAMVQFALVDVEAHQHLERVERASRMWQAIAAHLRELSESLRREIELLSPQWTDSTGVAFLLRATRCKAGIDEWLERIDAHQPWRALDDLARQLLLTRGRLVDTVEHPTEGLAPEVAADTSAAHLTELDRYFLAAAEALLGAAGGHELPDATTLAGGGIPGLPGVLGPTFAGGGLPGAAAPVPLGGTLPPGAVGIPGLIAIPPGASAGRYGQRGNDGLDSSELPGFDPRAVAGGDLSGGPGGGSGEGGSFDPADIAGGSPGSGGVAGLPGGSGSGSNLTPQIEQAADPAPFMREQATHDAPQMPETAEGGGGSASGAGGARPMGMGMGMMPPMMMMPMRGGLAGNRDANRRSGAAQVNEGGRNGRGPQPTPGVPPRLRGRSSLGDPAAGGLRPVAMSAKSATPPTAPSVPAETLDHEAWQVENPGAATPLKPEPMEEQPRRIRRPRA